MKIFHILLLIGLGHAVLFNTVIFSVEPSDSEVLNQLLGKAIEKNNVAEVIQSLEEGANINFRDSQGRTPLHKAVQDDLLQIAELLLNRGAHVNWRDNDGYAPIHKANDPFVVNLLLQRSADINIKSNEGYTPLHTAAFAKYMDIVKLLLEKGADINIPNHNGFTPLHTAVHANAPEIVKLLLAEGAAVNAQDENGNTPLHYAASRGYTQIAKLLLDNDAKMTIQNKKGDTPLEEALSLGRDTAKLFKEYAKKQNVPLPATPSLLDAIVKKAKGTQTGAYLSIPQLKDLVETKFRKLLPQYLGLINSIVEQEMRLNDYDVVYHAQMIEFKFFQDILKELLAWLHSRSNSATFEYLRIPGIEYEFNQKVSEFISDTFGEIKTPALSEEKRKYLDHHPEIQKRLLSVNLSLFGNAQEEYRLGECSFCYFIQNISTTKIDILSLLKNLLAQAGINEKFFSRFNDLYHQFINIPRTTHDESGNLLQIFIPKTKINDYLYLSERFGIPLKTIKIKNTSGNMVVTNVDSLGSEKIIDLYRNDPNEFDPLEMDSMQARLFLTNLFLLNPESGVKIYSYSMLDSQALSQYNKELKVAINEMMVDWATQRTVMSKELAVNNKNAFDQKVGILLKTAMILLTKGLTIENMQGAHEVNNKLSTLIEIYGTRYGSSEQLNNIKTVLHDLVSKFGFIT